MRKTLLLLSTLFGASCIFSTTAGKDCVDPETNRIAPDFAKIRLESQARTIAVFLENHPVYNKSMAFLIDMKRRSGSHRFFVYDLQARKAIDSGLVAHGSGSETAKPGTLLFSNTENSNCTSLGRYRIGTSYHGRFGKAYKLHGLDTTNSNAMARNIVLHAYRDVPYASQERDICNSLGCPMVNAQFYERLQRYIDRSQKPIILNIYYE